jgi:PAS domain S-box-containing protein
MTEPGPPDQPLEPNLKPVDELISSPEFVRALESDECCLVLDRIPIALAVARLSGAQQKICYSNVAFQKLTGLPAREAEGKTWAILDGFVHEDDAALTLGRAAAEGEDFLGTFRNQRHDGPGGLVVAYLNRIENDDGTENYRIAALVDVSYQERGQRDAFEQQIRDKDMLLKEIQHRVKNNLQLITALIRLEARSAQRGDTVDLDRLAGRIEALALLYQVLSLDSFRDDLDLGSYLSEIASAAVRAYSRSDIRLEVKVGYVPVSVNVAMPVGLLVNELLTNAFKYAFSGRAEGTITVECSRLGDDRYRIAVSDDGRGFPSGVNWPARGKLAALILQTLRENTRTTELTLDSAPGRGTRVSIEFVTRGARKPN